MHQLMYSNPDHSNNESRLQAADLYVPPPFTTFSCPSWSGKEAPDDRPTLWSHASGASTFSLTTGISPQQSPSIVSPRSTPSGDSLFTRTGDEPLIYASLWPNRLPSISQPHLEDPISNLNRAHDLTSSERPQGHFTVNQQAESQVPVPSETTDTAQPSAPVSVSRKRSSSSIRSRLSQRSIRSLRESLKEFSLSPLAANGSERSGSPTAPNNVSLDAGDGLASTTDRIMAACASDIADLWKDSVIRKTLDDFFGIRVESEAGL